MGNEKVVPPPSVSEMETRALTEEMTDLENSNGDAMKNDEKTPPRETTSQTQHGDERPDPDK